MRYLAVAHNWASRAAPYLTGGETLPRAFHWAAAGGKRVLVWHTDSPHGIAYLEGNLLGLADSYGDAVDLLPEYLAALASRGYPYAGPHETLGLPEAGTRAPYPFDLLHLRVQGLLADNAGPSLVPAEIAAAWSDEFAYPELVPSTNRDFFEELEERHGAGLETFRGDWADWWADGLGSAAREVGFNRRAQAAVRTAQTLHVMADALTGAEPAPGVARSTRVYERMALFDEHTWCAAHPGGDALTGRESGGAAVAVEGGARCRGARPRRRTARRRSRALPLRAQRFDPGAQPERPPAQRRRGGLPAGEPCHSRAGRGRRRAWGARAVRARTARVEPQPAAGARALVRRPRRARRSATAASTLVEDGAGQPEVVPGTLENEHYRLELEGEGGHALSLLDRELGSELVDAASAFGFAQVVRDLYGGPLQATRRASGAPVTYAEGRGSNALVMSRSVPVDGVLERSANAVEERAVIRTRAPGFDLVETTFRLVRGIRRLDVSVRLVKHATAEKESVHVVFPFAANRPAGRVRADRGSRRRAVRPGLGARTCTRSVTGSRSRAATRPSPGPRCRRRSCSSATSSFPTRRTRRRSTARGPGS